VEFAEDVISQGGVRIPLRAPRLDGAISGGKLSSPCEGGPRQFATEAQLTRARDYLRSLKENGIKKGCYFEQQLTGDESPYHTMNFVNGQQQLMRMTGEKAYMESLKKTNSRSSCLKK